MHDCANSSAPAHLDILFCQVIVNDFRVALAGPLGGETLSGGLYEGQLFISRSTIQT